MNDPTLSSTGQALRATERVRNALSFLLVGSYILVIPGAMLWIIPATNKDLVTYMIGQLSGMALMALGFYFTNKVGQEAIDAKRIETNATVAEALKATVEATSSPGDNAVKAADDVAKAAVEKKDEIKGKAQDGE